MLGGIPSGFSTLPMLFAFITLAAVLGSVFAGSLGRVILLILEMRHKLRRHLLLYNPLPRYYSQILICY